MAEINRLITNCTHFAEQQYDYPKGNPQSSPLPPHWLTLIYTYTIVKIYTNEPFN